MTKLPSDWKWVAFGQIVATSQYGLSCAMSPDGGTPILRMNNIGDGRLSTSHLAYVKLTDDSLGRFRLNRGDLLFNRTNSRALVGKTALFDAEGEYVFASYLVRFGLDRATSDPRFVCYFLNLEGSRRKLRDLATPGVSQSNINPATLRRRFLVPLPPLREQRKIADILDVWDRAIAKTVSMIRAKAHARDALVVSLLTGKMRFREFKSFQWKNMRIGELVSLAPRAVPKPTSRFLGLGIRSHGKGTFLKLDVNPGTIQMPQMFEVRKDDLIVNITFAWEGAIAVAQARDDRALVSHRFPTYEFNRSLVLPEYFRYVIAQNWFVRRLAVISPGGPDVTGFSTGTISKGSISQCPASWNNGAFRLSSGLAIRKSRCFKGSSTP
jgi:type I restriction enzyme S subunit